MRSQPRSAGQHQLMTLTDSLETKQNVFSPFISTGKNITSALCLNCQASPDLSSYVPSEHCEEEEQTTPRLTATHPTAPLIYCPTTPLCDSTTLLLDTCSTALRLCYSTTTPCETNRESAFSSSKTFKPVLIAAP